MRHALIRCSVLIALLMAVLPLRAASPAGLPDDLGGLGGSPFPVGPGKVGRNGTIPLNTIKSTGTVPAAWTASGTVVIGTGPGTALAANGLGQVVGVLQHPEDPWEAYLWTPPGTLTIIASPLAFSLTPQVINEAGQVAGVADMNNGEQHAFLWSAAGGFRDLGWLGGFSLQVNDITENGLVVGTARLANGDDRAFQSRNGGMIRELGTLGGNLSFANAANDDGVIVGSSRTPDNNFHAFVYSKGKMTALASSSTESFATDINAGGTIVGGGISGSRVAMIWSPAGVPQEIAGADTAEDINDAGIVAMTGGLEPFETKQAFLWNGTALLPAGTPDDATSEAVAVTADGRLVGRRVDWSGVSKVFVRSPGGVRTFVDGVAAGYSRALLVNASGQIAGFSRTIEGYNRAFVWTPDGGDGSMVQVPAPAGWHTMPVGLNAAGAVAGVANKTPGSFGAEGPSFFWSGSGDVAPLGPVQVVDLNNAGQVLAFDSGSAFVWQNGTVTGIPSLGQGSLVPADINNLGQVVGKFNVDPWTIHAFSWKPGAAASVDLGTLGGAFSEAVAVNDAGQIAGNSSLTGDVVSHAFRVVAGKKMTDLGALGPGGGSAATAINKNGVVVGTSLYEDNGSAFRAFLYDTKIRDLGDLADFNGWPWAINDSREVIGWRVAGEFSSPRAFVSVGGGPIADLPLGDGSLSRAFAINGSGVGVGDIELADGQMLAVRWFVR